VHISKIIALLLALLLALAVPAAAQGSATAALPPGAIASLRAEIGRAESKGITVGFAAAFAESGEEIFVHRERVPLIPASNMKLLTAGVALLTLGPEHELFTDLVAHGEMRDDTLEGALRLRGEGDPTLRSRGEGGVLARWVEAVQAAGIRRVTGDLLIDDRAFDREFRGRDWPLAPPTRGWMAEVSALSFDHGTLEVLVSAGGEVGARAAAEVRPPGSGVTLDNRLVTCRRRGEHVVDIRRRFDRNRLQLRGKVVLGTRGQAFEIAMHDMPLIVGECLRHALAERGVAVGGAVRRPRPGELESGGRLLLRIRTEVSAILPVLLRSSQNHRAEMLLKHLGAARGPGGSFAGGGAVIGETLRLRGITASGAEFIDGSGLSRANRLTAGLTLAFLQAVWRSKVRDDLRAALPAGGEGTLRRRLGDLGVRVRAKTGTLNRVSALSGFVDTEGGQTVSFSILMNSEGAGSGTMRRYQDRLVEILAGLGGQR
jgi:D-alanyl-D-alanine carboxypeptidase/D-alanyl-D-alanine-endopeptidase (penicillin-binding protein 4)